MIDLTQDGIQVLIDHPKGEGMIVSWSPLVRRR